MKTRLFSITFPDLFRDQLFEKSQTLFAKCEAFFLGGVTLDKITESHSSVLEI